MSIFSEAELAFLAAVRLARLATIGPDGAPQVRPVGFSVDATTGTVDIPGRDNPNTQKWRNIARNPGVALVIDDVLPPWEPRVLEIRGIAELLPDLVPEGAAEGVAPGVIRIRPRRILVFGIEKGAVPARTVAA
ncbi:MAG TPA: PPOX class F420-dependent oxidoreductase [Pseudonocardia sp.]